jgi:fatty acid desaturase
MSPNSLASAPTIKRQASAYGILLAQVKRAGLMRRQQRYYWLRLAVLVLAVAGCGVLLVMLRHSWWQLGIAVLLAVISTQLGFLGHDAGHGQIFATRSANAAIGRLVANLGVGLSYSWWVDKHVRHHSHPNDEQLDPDVAAGALVFAADQARASRGLARWFYRFQAYAFFPLLTLEGINLRVASFRHLISARGGRRWREFGMLVTHVSVYLGAIFLLLPPVKAMVFVVVHQGLFGVYLGCSFAPNHKGMPPLSAADKQDFLLRQVLTSRNVRGGWFVDFLLGGLNYQIEHHLFPSMPRPNLRHAQRLVHKFCAEHSIKYHQTGLFASYAQALRHLDQIGRLTRQPAG